MSVTRVINSPEGFVTPEDLAANAQPVAAESAVPSTRVHTGAVTYNASQDNAQQSGGVVRHTISHDGVEGGSVISTRQRINGRDTVELIPGKPWSRVQIAMAEQQGVLRQTAPGIWQDVTDASGQQASPADMQAEQQQEPAPSPEVFTPAESEAWGAALAGVRQGAVDVAVAGMAKAIATGGSMDAVAARLVQDTGMSNEQAAQRLNDAVTVQEAALERAMVQAGLHGEQLQAFYDTARSHPQRLTDALLHFIHGRDPSRFVDWGREYVRTAARRSSSGN